MNLHINLFFLLLLWAKQFSRMQKIQKHNRCSNYECLTSTQRGWSYNRTGLMSATIELIKQASGLLIKSERTNYWALSADSSLVQLCLQDQCQRQLSEHREEGVSRLGWTRVWNQCNIWVASYDSRLSQIIAVSWSSSSHKWIKGKKGGSQATRRVSSLKLLWSDRVFESLGSKAGTR